MFARKSPEGTYCMVCDKQAVIDVYFYGDNLEDAITRYDPDIRVCNEHLQELYRVLPPITRVEQHAAKLRSQAKTFRSLGKALRHYGEPVQAKACEGLAEVCEDLAQVWEEKGLVENCDLSQVTLTRNVKTVSRGGSSHE